VQGALIPGGRANTVEADRKTDSRLEESWEDDNSKKKKEKEEKSFQELSGASDGVEDLVLRTAGESERVPMRSTRGEGGGKKKTPVLSCNPRPPAE